MSKYVVNFKFGTSSKRILKELADDLMFAMTETLKTFTTVDFGLTEGKRTKEKQRENVAAGVSKTMNSRHIPYTPVTKHKHPRPANVDGATTEYAHAVDIMAYVNGKGTWKAEYYYEIANAVRTMAIRYDLAIRWGGCWQDIRKVKDVRKAVEAYGERCKKAGRKPLFDLMHYELIEKDYPKKIKG